MKPRPDLHPDQPANFIHIQQAFKANPNDSIFMYGESGAGKSTILYSLYYDAVMAGRPAFVGTLDEIIDAYNQWELHGRDTMSHPLILNPETLADYGQRGICCFVGIDEISFEKPTDYKLEVFFRYVRAIHDNHHQLITTSNFDEDGLVALWGGGSLSPRALVRRLVDEATPIEFKLLTDEVQNNATNAMGRTDRGQSPNTARRFPGKV